MFDVYCPGHRARVLLTRRSIDALTNTEHGVELHWTCRCGTRGVLRPLANQPTRHAARPAA